MLAALVTQLMMSTHHINKFTFLLQTFTHSVFLLCCSLMENQHL